MKIEFYCEPDKEEHFTKQLLDYLGYQYNINEIYLSLSKDKSVANAINTASLGGINRLKHGTIIKVVPNPANPRIMPPTITMAMSGNQ